MGYLKQAWLVIVLALVFGAALAAVQAALDQRIEDNKLAKSFAVVPSLVAGAEGGKTKPLQVAGQTVYRAVDKDGKLVGWVVKASGQGFADVIQLLIGLDPKAQTVTGLFVLGQLETPGLGNRIEGGSWRAQFRGKSTASPLAAVKTTPDGNQVQAVTGATISSESVCAIVNEAVAKVHKELAERASSERIEQP